MGPQNTGFVFLDYFCHGLTLDQGLTKIIQKSAPLIFQGIFCPALVKCQCGTKNTLKNQGVALGTKFHKWPKIVEITTNLH